MAVNLRFPKHSWQKNTHIFIWVFLDSYDKILRLRFRWSPCYVSAKVYSPTKQLF